MQSVLSYKQVWTKIGVNRQDEFTANENIMCLIHDQKSDYISLGINWFQEMVLSPIKWPIVDAMYACVFLIYLNDG